MLHKTNNTRFQRGNVLLLSVLIFVGVSVAFLLGFSTPLIRQLQISRDFNSSQKAYYAADAGSEDAFYRVRNNLLVSFPLTVGIDDATSTVTLSTISFTEQEVRSQGIFDNNYRTTLKSLQVGDGFSFFYGMQAGVGGIYLYNNARVEGNVYSNGSVIGNSSSPNSYNVVNGSVISAGLSGLVQHINASSSVYSHNIFDDTVNKDAYYQHIDNTTVVGTLHPNSPDQLTLPFPITDQMLDNWEADAATGGSVTCTSGSYTISSSVSIGPKKIPCNLVINGNGTVVTLTGNVWVSGNITISGSGGSGAQLKVSNSITAKSVTMIADNPTSRLANSTISISNNSNFYGSFQSNESYVLLVSRNTSSESGGSTVAIDVVNGAAGNVLVYAPHGEIRMQNNVTLREVTAYKISAYNNTVVNYFIGLAQTLFTSGPSGTWNIKRWKEI